MYSTPSLPAAVDHADECGVTFKPISGPPMDPSSGFFGIWTYFWAFSLYIESTTGTMTGGGHFGPQWDDGVVPYGTGRHNCLNWGCYDEVTGGLTALRGTLYDLSDDFGPNGLFYFDYGDSISMRLFKSPKQDWTDADLDSGTGQVAPYTTGNNQQANETAFRCVVKRNQGPWIFFRDVLVRDARASKPLLLPQLFTENLYDQNPADTPHFAVDSYPYDSICDFSDFIWDGRRVGNSWTLTYVSGATNVDQRVQASTYIRHIGATGTTQTNPPGTVIAAPTNFYTAAPANVTPAITDVSARVATRRPWY